MALRSALGEGETQVKQERRYDLVELLGLGGALLFIVCLYTSPAHLYPQLAVLRPSALAAGMMISGLLLARIFRGWNIRLAGPAGGMGALLLALVFLSPLWALRPAIALAFALGGIKLLVAYAGLTGTLRNVKKIRLAMCVAALASMVPAWGTVSRYRNGIELVEGFRGSWIGLLANPNELAMVMSVTVPWTLLCFHQSRKWVLKLALLVAFGLQVSAVVATHSRGGALGLLAAVVAIIALSPRRLPAVALGVAASLAVVALAPSSFWDRTGTISSYESDASARGRLLTWENGKRAIVDKPLLGVGAGNYVESWNRYMHRNIRELAFASHNLWMQVVVELGLFGLSAFLGMLFFLTRGLWKARGREEGGAEARALLASLVAVVVSGQTGGYAFNWFFWMVLGLAGAVVACTRIQSREREVDGVQLAAA